MIENRILAGAIVGIPISLVCLAYVLVRRETVVAAFTSGADPMPADAASALAFGTAVFLGPVLGVAAGFVLDRMPSQEAYLGLALGAATLMSIAAIASHTPMPVEKIVLNYLVAAVFGLALPRLVG